MKRLIKFRGKRTDTGAWIYGDLLTSNGTECEISDWNDVVYSRYDVDPDTVGQFTGLLDKNGMEVCEGDVIQDGSNSIGVIMWFSTGWGMASYTLGFDGINSYTAVDSFYSNEVNEWTAIGNIYDNPELLKGGSNV